MAFMKGALVLATLLISSAAAASPACIGARGGRLEDLPPSVSRAFLDRLAQEKRDTSAPGLAAPGQPFNATDLRNETLPDRRLMFAIQEKARYVIAYEHGGHGLHAHVVAYRQRSDGTPELLINLSTSPELACALGVSLLWESHW